MAISKTISSSFRKARIELQRCGRMMQNPKRGRYGGWMVATRPKSTYPWLADSKTVAACFTQTMSLTADRSKYDLFGLRHRAKTLDGSKHSLLIMVQLGKSTGRCASYR